jgi:peptidoglycan/LPS O-acetylase OafA/YrhL
MMTGMGGISIHTAGHLRYRADIDGMRAVAVIAVVLFHAFPKVLPGGFAGVDAFFVISGYLITSIIVGGLDGDGFSFADFYARRVRRLFPALIVVLIATLAAGFWILLPSALASLAKNAMASAFFSANLMLWSETGYFDIDAKFKPLLHLWSLGIEEQFYLAWPLALWLTVRRWRTALIVGTIIGSFTLNIALIDKYPEATFYLPFTRIWELIAGALLVGLSVKSTPLREVAFPIFACVGSILVFTLTDSHTQFPGWAALAPVAVTAAAILSEGSVCNRLLLSNPTAVFIGKISYPLYLWHWPLLVFGRIYPLRPLTAPETVGLILAAFVLAWLTYALIEKPFRFRQLLGVRTALAGMATAVLVAAFVLVKPPRLPGEIQQLVDTSVGAPEWREHKCFLMRGDQRLDFTSACVDEERPLVALWGDSAAASLMPGLRDLQSDHHFGIAQFTTSGCQPLLVASAETDALCVTRNRAVLSRLSEIKPQAVLLNALWRTSADELKPTIAALRAIGVRPVILGRVPVWQGGLPNLVAIYYRRTGELLPEFSSLFLEGTTNDDAIRLAAGQLGVAYISLRDPICQNGACQTRVGSDLMVSDWLHFTATGSIYVMRKIAPALMPTAGLATSR